MRKHARARGVTERQGDQLRRVVGVEDPDRLARASRRKPLDVPEIPRSRRPTPPQKGSGGEEGVGVATELEQRFQGRVARARRILRTERVGTCQLPSRAIGLALGELRARRGTPRKSGAARRRDDGRSRRTARSYGPRSPGMTRRARTSQRGQSGERRQAEPHVNAPRASAGRRRSRCRTARAQGR